MLPCVEASAEESGGLLTAEQDVAIQIVRSGLELVGRGPRIELPEHLGGGRVAGARDVPPEVDEIGVGGDAAAQQLAQFRDLGWDGTGVIADVPMCACARLSGVSRNSE